MKNLFHGHFKPSGAQFEKMWSESIFAFDANIILNLYRYSESTKDELLKVMGLLSDRIWLPFQAAEEYFKNRITTIGGQSKEYDEVSKELKKFVTDLGNKKRHPFLTDGLYAELKALASKIELEFEESKKILTDKIYNDEIQEAVSSLFEAKVGDKLEQKALDVIYKEGQVRYEAEIAPGFRDGNKDKSGNLYRKFGDLIIWNELINKAKLENKSVIFITDDKKDDWWLEYSGRTISPLPMLIQEFKEKSSQDFYMYTADRFMQSATDYLSEKVKEEVIVELKQVRQEEESLRDAIKRAIDDIVNNSHVGTLATVSDESELDNSHTYRVASEEEILRHLTAYANVKALDDDSFIGLKYFVTSYLAKMGIEINHSYAAINRLIAKGLVKIYTHSVGEYSVKAIDIVYK